MLKTLESKTVLIFIFLFLLLILFRSLNLISAPLFVDEGIYMSWAKLFTINQGHAYVSIQDGKTPLFFWLVSLIHQSLPDYLLAGRLISLIAGILTCLIFSLIAFFEQGKKLAFITLLIFLITPYGYFIDRLALTDPLMLFLASLGLFFIYLPTKKQLPLLPSILFALISGICFGLSYYVKPSAQLLLIATVLSLPIIVIFQPKNKLKRLAILILSIISIIFIYQQMFSFLRVGAYRLWSGIQTKQTQLTYSPNQIISNLTHFEITTYQKNSPYLLQYLTLYLGPLLILIPFSIYLIVTSQRPKLWLIVFSLILISATFLSAKVSSSRYYYPLYPPIVLLEAIAVLNLLKSKKKSPFTLAILCLFATAFLSSLIIFNYSKSLLPQDDTGFYLGSELTVPQLTKIEQILHSSPDSILAVSGSWGVTDGVIIYMQDHNLNAIETRAFLDKSPLNTPCLSPGKVIENQCWLFSSSSLEDSTKANKFLLLTLGNINLDDLSKLRNYDLILSIRRPQTNNYIYLLKLK